MKRIRLQVVLLPQDQAASQSPPSQTRHDNPRPWLQVCTEEMTLQELWEQIVKRFSSIHAGRGTLKIRHLETDFGEILALDDRVGDVFDDRAPSGENRTSIVKVAHYPLDPLEQFNLQRFERFGSLLPESTARPQKRRLGYTSQSEIHNVPTFATTEESDRESSVITPDHISKRRKIHASPHVRESESGRQRLPNGYINAGPRGQSAEVMLLGSSTQVHDSQAFPVETDAAVLTPPLEAHRGSTKSESPEDNNVDLTVDPNSSSRPRTPEQPIQPEHSNSEFQFNSPVTRAQPPLNGEGHFLRQTPARTRNSPFVQQDGAKSNQKSRNEDLFDPIETDSEGFGERQQIHRPRGVRLSKTPGSSDRSTVGPPTKVTSATPFKKPEIPHSKHFPVPRAKNQSSAGDFQTISPARHLRAPPTDAAKRSDTAFRPSPHRPSPARNASQKPSDLSATRELVGDQECDTSRDMQDLHTPQASSSAGHDTPTLMQDERRAENSSLEIGENGTGSAEQDYQPVMDSDQDQVGALDGKSQSRDGQLESGLQGVAADTMQTQGPSSSAFVSSSIPEQSSAQSMTQVSPTPQERDSHTNTEAGEIQRRLAYTEGQRDAARLVQMARERRMNARREEELAQQGEQMMTTENGAKHLARTPVAKSSLRKTTPASNSAKTPDTTRALKRVSASGKLYYERSEAQKEKRRELTAKRKEEQMKKKDKEPKIGARQSILLNSDGKLEEIGTQVLSSVTVNSSRASVVPSSSPLTTKSDGKRLQSALRSSRSSNSGGRSVSFNDDTVSNRPEIIVSPKDTPRAATTQKQGPATSPLDIDTNLETQGAASSQDTPSFSRSSINGGPSQSKKVQSKINVTRDRKMKAPVEAPRTLDPPHSAPITVPDDSDQDSGSMFFREDDNSSQADYAEAGPSTRKNSSVPTSRGKPESEIESAAVQKLEAVIDPILSSQDQQRIVHKQIENIGKPLKALSPVSTGSRSPARGLSETDSSADETESTESSSDSESSSESSTASNKSATNDVSQGKRVLRGAPAESSGALLNGNEAKSPHKKANQLPTENTSKPTETDHPIRDQPKLDTVKSKLGDPGSRPPANTNKSVIKSPAQVPSSSAPTPKSTLISKPRKKDSYRYPKISEMNLAAQASKPLESSSTQQANHNSKPDQPVDSEDDPSSSSSDESQPGSGRKNDMVKTLKNLAKNSVPAFASRILSQS